MTRPVRSLCTLLLTASFALALSLALSGPKLGAQDGDPVDALAAPAARAAQALHFVTSEACATCHSNADGAQAMRDEKERWIAPYTLWQASMMANSARDPLYRAVVSLEAAATPSRSAEIEARCLRCHAPLASVELKKRGEFTPSLALLREDSDRGQLALDGVACAVCHQIQAEGLGTQESFNGGYRVGEGRKVFGPHVEPKGELMKGAVGFTPTHGPHMLDSALCGTCHTQRNEAYLPDGSPAGSLYPEQATFLEWRSSAYRDDGSRPTSCQACHVPRTSQDGASLVSVIARGADGKDLGELTEREPYGRHLFVGGNTLVLGILRDNAELLKPRAPREAFNETIQRTLDQLGRAARLEAGEAALTGEELRIPLRVRNLAGHKLPTGHPTRRTWVRLVVRDAEGRVVFSSGDFDQQGRILDGTGSVLASEKVGGPLQPHHREVKSADAVQIYEAVMNDSEGKLTYLLTRAVAHRKDNRLLPAGWQFDQPSMPDTLPQGLGGDLDFLDGGDAILYRVPVNGRPGPFAVEATLLYQTLGARYAAEILAHDTPEVRSFRTLYQGADRQPVPLAKVELKVE